MTVMTSGVTENRTPISAEAYTRLMALCKPKHPSPDATVSQMAWNECQRWMQDRIESCFVPR